MNDDPFCLFVILACMVTLAVPEPGQLVVAVFGLALAILARSTPEHRDAGSPEQRGVERRPHAG
jgi:hypothetical protein